MVNNQVNRIAIDTQGNKWFGAGTYVGITFQGGLSKFDGKNWTTYTNYNGLADDFVRAIAVDAQGNKWFGTDKGGVLKYDGTNWTTYTKTDGLAYDCINAISIDAQGNKWFGTYGGDDTKVPVYGRLYTWYAATDSRNVCPANYRIPSQTDWNTLLNYLINNGYGYGGSGSGIGKSITAASIEWASDSIVGSVGFNLASNNRSGFLAFPASVRQENGSVYNTGGGAWWWSSTKKTDGSKLYYYIQYNTTDLTMVLFNNGNDGNSIRCMKDAITDVNQLSDSQIKLYPNPAADGFYIETGEKINAVSIYNLNGILMLNKEVTSKDIINISSLSQGVYFVKIANENGLVVNKLIKK